MREADDLFPFSYEDKKEWDRTCKLYLHDVDKENFTFPRFDTFHFISWFVS